MRTAWLRRFALLSTILAAACVLAATASAAGSTTIAGAPTVQFGQQEFGNTSCCQASPWAEFWKLQLTAGDHVTIDWDYGAFESNFLSVFVYTPDTTDYNVLSADPFAEGDGGGGPHGELKIVANASGAWPLSFSNCGYSGAPCGDGGAPYDFTAYVKHSLRLFMPRRRTIKSHSSIVVNVHFPDGSAVNDSALRLRLQGQWSRHWHSLGTASPANGKAMFRLRLPKVTRGRVVKLRVRASGASYIAAAAAVTARVRR